MTLIELKQIIDETLEMHSGERGENLKVVIPVKGNQMGPIPTIGIKGARKGFDWENDLFILWPEKELRKNDA